MPLAVELKVGKIDSLYGRDFQVAVLEDLGEVSGLLHYNFAQKV